MNIISANPYRLLGVFSNSPKKEVVGNESRIKAYVKIGKSVSFNTDFVDLIGPVERTEETVATAVSQTTLAVEKVQYALFWFIKRNAIDEIAFNHLLAGSIDHAMQIWHKKTTASSLVNMAVCSLIQEQWTYALYCYAQLVDTGFYEGFAKSVAGEDFRITKKDFTDKLANLLRTNFPRVNWMSLLKVRNVIIGGESVALDEAWTDSFLAKTLKETYVDSIRKRITEALQDAENVEQKNAALCLKTAQKMAALSSELQSLGAIISVTDILYTTLSDKVTMVLDRLCKDYYNNTDYYRKAERVLPLVTKACTLACSSSVKEICTDSLKFIKSKVAELPPPMVEEQCRKIDSLLTAFTAVRNNRALLTCVQECRDLLNTIKLKLGESDAVYISQSTMVVHFAINIIVDEVNEKQKAYNDAPADFDRVQLTAYKDSLKWAKSIMDLLAHFAKDKSCENRFKENFDVLKSLYSKYFSIYNYNARQSSAGDSGDGCFNTALIITSILVILTIAIVLICYRSPSSSSEEKTNNVENTTTYNTENKESEYSYDQDYNSTSDDEETQKKQEEEWLEEYKGNTLTTGYPPFSSQYGTNPKSGNARLKVVAPTDCDVIVMVKTVDGTVVRHAYIESQDSYTFRLKPGTYQAFFIFGRSWCPEKTAPNGGSGFFLEDVSYSKDEPQRIGQYQELQYTLQTVQNGNFHAEGSYEDEVF